MPKKQRARRVALTGLAAAGLSSSLVLGHVTGAPAEDLAMRLTAENTVIAAGGLFDTASDRVRNKLQGAVIPANFGYYGVPYPATTDLSGSRDAGVVTMDQAIRNTYASAPQLLVVSYSEGTLVAEQERRNLEALTTGAPSPSQLSFLQVASPFAGNGGIYARFPGISIPGVTDAMGGAQPTKYDTTYVALEYDSYADFPAYFNPVALLNTLLGIRYSHPDPAYDPIDAANSPSYVTPVDNAAGGKDTYVLIYNPHLPLLGPLRDLSSLLGISAITEPFISAIEPLLRLAVDMGYTDRVNADPAASVPFSLITPPEKFIEAIEGIPGAIAQGLTNFLSGGAVQAPPNPNGNLQQSVPLPTGTSQATPLVTSQARAALVAAPEVSPEVSPEKQSTTTDSTPTATATPTPTATATATATVTTEPTPASDPTPTADPAPSPTVKPAASTSTPGTTDLHPTVTSDGNKFTPGTAGAPAQSSGTGGTTPSDPEKPTTTTTPATTPSSTTPSSTTPTDPTASETKPSDPKPAGSSAGSTGGSSSAGAAAA